MQSTTVEKNKKKAGRPKRKMYDEAKQFRNLLQGVDYCFACTGEIKATAIELGISSVKVKKLLITSGKLNYDETAQIQRLLAYGRSIGEIQQELGLKKSSINSYLPYSKVPYKSEDISANAERCELYRKRKAAVDEINDMDSLRTCLTLFSGYSFRTANGRKFSYVVRNCEIDGTIQEIVIGREEQSITMSAVEQAYERLVHGGEEYRSEENIQEQTYLYPIFCRFGLMKEGTMVAPTVNSKKAL